MRVYVCDHETTPPGIFYILLQFKKNVALILFPGAVTFQKKQTKLFHISMLMHDLTEVSFLLLELEECFFLSSICKECYI